MIKKNEFYKRDPKIVFHEVDNEVFILDERGSEVIKLNKTGKILWHHLGNKTNTSYLVNILLSEYEGEREEIEKDTNDLISLLLKRKLIVKTKN